MTSTLSPASEGAVQPCGAHSRHWAADPRGAERFPPHVGARGARTRAVPIPLPVRSLTGLVFVLRVQYFDTN